MGVFLDGDKEIEISLAIPHACGGVSQEEHQNPLPSYYSPRVWGCFCLDTYVYFSAKLFPTRVGVFPTSTGLRIEGKAIPHACGGVSIGTNVHTAIEAYSPRVWGCFCSKAGPGLVSFLFPTRVGVFLR